MALRRLARHALHRAVPVPGPPPPLVSFPPELRSHILLLRFSTSSSDPPQYMVDYLVSTCGVSPDKAAKAAPRFAHLRSPDRPDAALAFLRSQGLTRAQVGAVVTSYPQLLLSDVDAIIAPKFRAVRSVGLTRAEATRRKVEFLTGTAGCGANDIVSNPVLLTYSLGKRMEPRCRAIEALKARDVDVGKERLVTILRKPEARFMERDILRYSHQAP